MMKSDGFFRDPTGEFAFDVPEYLFYLLLQAVRRRDAAFDAVAPLGLNAARVRTLAIVRRIEACTMSDLARFAMIDRTTLTREVDQLVAADLVRRSVPANDRRRVVLSITDKGDAVYKTGVSAMAPFNRKALEGMASEQQRDLVRGMQAMVRNLSADETLADSLIAFAALSGQQPETAR